MAWGTLTPAQFVTFLDAQESPFAILVTLPSTQEFMTKAKALEHLNVAAANLASYANNQFVKKEDLVAGREKAWRGIYEYCIQDGRPMGLETKNIKYGYYTYGNVYFPDGTFIITTEKDYSGDYTYSGAFDCSFYGWSDGQELAAGIDVQAAGWTIGDTVYLGTGDDQDTVADGWYVIDRAYVAPDYNSWDTAHHIEGGIITEITYSPW